MTNPPKVFIVYGEHIRWLYIFPVFNTPISFCPRHSHTVYPPVRDSTFPPDIYNCIRTPSLSGNATSKTYNAINTRPTIIHRAFSRSKQSSCLLLYTTYLSDTSAAISKCKP